MPMKIVGLITIVSEPTTVQVAPSVDRDAVTTSPARSSFTQYGACPAPPDVLVDTPPVETLRWNASPFVWLTTIIACLEPAVSVSRIITPLFVHASVGLMVATRATI